MNWFKPKPKPELSCFAKGLIKLFDEDKFEVDDYIPESGFVYSFSAKINNETVRVGPYRYSKMRWGVTIDGTGYDLTDYEACCLETAYAKWNSRRINRLVTESRAKHAPTVQAISDLGCPQ